MPSNRNGNNNNNNKKVGEIIQIKENKFKKMYIIRLKIKKQNKKI